jgi:hypothetical protein
MIKLLDVISFSFLCSKCFYAKHCAQGFINRK